MTDARYQVGIARCESYNPKEVEKALALAIERSGGLPSRKAERLLLKANLLAPRAPEEAVTTHPEILRAMAVKIYDEGRARKVIVSDSPGYIFQDQWEQLFQKTGVDKLRGQTPSVDVVPLVSEGLREVELHEGKTLTKARITGLTLESDQLYSVAKLKTHVETEMTGCIKNLFGIADTATRKKAHSAPSLEWLAQGIVDLFLIRKPDFCILDAVESMEGNGPSRGTPVKTGWLLAGQNALAVDMIGALIMGYESPQRIPLLKIAASRGLGPETTDEILLNGASLAELPHQGFCQSSGKVRWIPTPLRGVAHGFVALKPLLRPEKCTRCGICAKVCPVDAITISHKGPRIDRSICVNCLCCHEMCPEGAMDVKKNLLARFL